MNISAFVGAVGFSKLWQGTHVESYQLLYPRINRQIDMEKGRATSTTSKPAPTCHFSWEKNLKYTDLGNIHKWKRICRSFPAFQFFQRKIPAYYWSKNYKFGCKRDSTRNFANTIPPATLHSMGMNYLAEETSPTGEKESSEWVPGLSQLCRIRLGKTVTSSNTQSTKEKPPWLAAGKRWGKRQIIISKRFKGTQFLLIVLRTSGGSPSMSLWECLIQNSPYQFYRKPQYLQG